MQLSPKKPNFPHDRSQASNCSSVLHHEARFWFIIEKWHRIISCASYLPGVHKASVEVVVLTSSRRQLGKGESSGSQMKDPLSSPLESSKPVPHFKEHVSLCPTSRQGEFAYAPSTASLAACALATKSLNDAHFPVKNTRILKTFCRYCTLIRTVLPQTFVIDLGFYRLLQLMIK